jgi:hypothetical protein
MGYNRSGERRKQKMKRRKREERRLTAKSAEVSKTPAPAK